MENNLRLVLIIISAIVITAIFIHGLWTIRKNRKNPYKLKASRDTIEPIARDFDKSGFDQDGVGRVKVIKPASGEKLEPSFNAVESTTETTSHDDNHLAENQSELEPAVKQLIDNVENDIPDAVKQEAVDEESSAPALALEVPEVPKRKEPTITFADPVIQPKPKIQPKPRTEVPKKDQLNLEFGDEIQTGAKQKKAAFDVNEPEPEVLILSVVPAQGQLISGAALLPTLLTLGMRFGEMDIFHRHQDSAGNGKVTFSCANMMNPGTFDIDNMETFTTQGISLFMQMPNDGGDAMTVFNQMLSAAKQIAQEFGGQVLDGQRSVMTKQTEQHYQTQIREFERKMRIASF